ncbi:MAG TPA: HK97 family phage prohead protease [Solirubrobacteraceae bacterium]|jgi:HK97 family phage prohead protease
MNGRIEIREAEQGGPLELVAYASVTETPYRVGPFTETIKRGAFKRSLGEGPDVQLLVNHGGLPLARTKSGTMTLAEDDVGLLVRAELDPSDPDVQALLPKLRREDMTEMSFAFRASEEEWDKRRTKRLVRSATIHRGDVSIVNAGANTATSVTVRAEDLTLEQRQRLVDRIGNRLCGPYQMPDPNDVLPARAGVVVGASRSAVDLARARRARHGGSRRPASFRRAEVVGSHVEIAKARAARRSRAGASTPPTDRYTDAEIAKLGEEGKALAKKDASGYAWPMADALDVAQAVKAFPGVPQSEREHVRRWIVANAHSLKVVTLLPASWDQSY